jgi:mannose-6-phosphate isomerase-like protein (cupin superfamily)
VHIQTIARAPVNRRGGQESYLLLGKGQFGAQYLAITWVEGAPGSEQRSHAHERAEQVYVIVRGHGLMRVAGEEESVGPGTMILVPPRTMHSIRNIGEEPLVYISATAPPFDPKELAADRPRGGVSSSRSRPRLRSLWWAILDYRQPE